MVEKSMLHILPISTLAAAGLGNMMSDVMGVGLGGVIESFAARLGVEAPPLTRAQQQLRVSRFTVHAGSAIGISIGCIIGMFPLLLLNRDEEEIHREMYHHGGSDVNEHGVAIHEPHSHAHGHAVAGGPNADRPAPEVSTLLASLTAAAHGLRMFLDNPRVVAFYEVGPAKKHLHTMLHHPPPVHSSSGSPSSGSQPPADGGDAKPDAARVVATPEHAAGACDDPELLRVVGDAAKQSPGAPPRVVVKHGRAMVAVRGVAGDVVGVLEVRYGAVPAPPCEGDDGAASDAAAASEQNMARVELAAMQLGGLAAALTLSGKQASRQAVAGGETPA